MPSPLRWPRALLVVATAAALLAVLVVAPEPAGRWLAKEGPVEHASHLVLLLAALTWLGLGLARGRALVMSCFLLVVLAEEVDWGAVYGLPALGVRIDAAVGHRNLHNALRGASYLLFALPLALYFGAPARRLGALAPTADERAAFALVAAAFVAFNLGPWERQAQELLEAVLYALLLAVGLRCAAGTRRLRS